MTEQTRVRIRDGDEMLYALALTAWEARELKRLVESRGGRWERVVGRLESVVLPQIEEDECRRAGDEIPPPPPDVATIRFTGVQWVWLALWSAFWIFAAWVLLVR